MRRDATDAEGGGETERDERTDAMRTMFCEDLVVPANLSSTTKRESFGMSHSSGNTSRLFAPSCHEYFPSLSRKTYL
jgi:hypothetical protein